MHQERTEKTNSILDQPPLEEPDYYQDQPGAEQGDQETVLACRVRIMIAIERAIDIMRGVAIGATGIILHVLLLRMDGMSVLPGLDTPPNHGHLTHRVVALHPWHDETFDVISQRLSMARLQRAPLRKPLPVRL